MSPSPEVKKTVEIVAQVKRKGIEPFQSVQLENEAFLVPPLPVTGLGGCTIMDCHYVLEVSSINSHTTFIATSYDIY